MTLYKYLDADRTPCNGGRGQWPKPGVWTKKITGLVACERGYHCCRARDLPYLVGPTLWTVEVAGERIDEGDKIVVGRARLLERTLWDEQRMRLYACDCAARVSRLLTDERSREAIRVSRRYALGEATAEELDAAESAAMAARDAALAAGAAARAARAAARAAAWAAAGGAAMAARSARVARVAGAAAWDAERAWQSERILLYATSPELPEPIAIEGGEQ